MLRTWKATGLPAEKNLKSQDAISYFAYDHDIAPHE